MQSLGHCSTDCLLLLQVMASDRAVWKASLHQSQISTHCLPLVSLILSPSTRLPLERGVEEETLPFFHATRKKKTMYYVTQHGTVQCYIYPEDYRSCGSIQLSMFCKLCAFRDVFIIPPAQFKKYYSICSPPYIRRLELNFNPST